MREQGVFINCSLEMPVEPTEKNFRQFEQENPSIHLNVYTPAADDEKCVPSHHSMLKEPKHKDSEYLVLQA